LRIAHLSSIWTVIYGRPSRYNWMLQYYLRAAGLLLPWIGTGRLIFPINCSDEEMENIATRFVAAASAMAADGWWEGPATTDREIRRQVAREVRAQVWRSLRRSRNSPRSR
jgi:glutamate-1-semialdehyde 2,1-aminomutase